MLKNKFKIITILTVLFLFFTIPMVKAENEVSNDTASSENTSNETVDSAINPINESPETNNNDTKNGNVETVNSEENFKKHDVYLTGDDVTIDYIIDGNLFVVANHVTINSQIGGDAFVCANSVTVGEQGYVFSNLFTCSKNANINGVVYDLYSCSENTTIGGYVYRDARIGSNNVNIFGAIGRNAYIGCNSLNFTQNSDNNTNNNEDSTSTSNTKNGVIHGDLHYSAKQEFSIPEDSVTGETSFKPDSYSNSNMIQKQILSLGTFIVTVVVIWLLCLWLAPKFIKNTVSLISSKKILPVIGLGILTPIVGIILTILLLILGITSTLSLLLFFTLFVLLAISTSIFVITINNIICNSLKITKTIGKLGILIISSIVLWAIGLIPYIASIVGLIAVILGLGIITYYLIFKGKKEPAN